MSLARNGKIEGSMGPECSLPFWRRPLYHLRIRRGSQEDGERSGGWTHIFSPTSPERSAAPLFHCLRRERGSWRQSQWRINECSARSKSTCRLDRGSVQSSDGIICRGCKQGILPGRKVFPLQALPALVIGEVWQPEEGLDSWWMLPLHTGVI